MRILDSTGDTAVAWEIDDQVAVKQAEEMFARLAGERKIPFARAAGAPANEAKRIKSFDPGADEIIWVRPITGG